MVTPGSSPVTKALAEPQPAAHCPECDYDLTALTEPRCPWCGCGIEPSVLAVPPERHRGRTWGLFAAAAACGAASALSMTLLLRGKSHLAVWDGLAVIAVAVAIAGHFSLAGILLAMQLHRALPWQLRSPLLRFAALFSVALGLLSGGRMLQPRPVLGVPVEAVLEFALVAALFTSPGWLLLALHTIARNMRAPHRATRRAGGNPSDAGVSIAPFRVDVARRIAVENVVAIVGPHHRRTTPAIDAAIERTWQTELALAAVEHRSLYDGALLRLHRASVNGADLTLQLGETSYREFFGTNVRDDGGARLLGRDFLANPLGISALLITCDGYVGLGRRGNAVALHAGTLHPFGGMVEPVDRSTDGTVDVAASLARELEEELTVVRSEWTDAHVTALVRDRTLDQPELLFDVNVAASREELRRRFASRGSDPEHIALEFAHDDPDSLLAWMDSGSRLVPIAEAALLLHGRCAWGNAWYEDACYTRFGALPGRQDPE